MSMDNISVTHADYVDGLSLRVYFSDKTSRVIDFGEFIASHPHPQYNRYAKPSFFKKYSIRSGNLIWGSHADLSFPIEALYTGDLEYCD